MSQSPEPTVTLSQASSTAPTHRPPSPSTPSANAHPATLSPSSSSPSAAAPLEDHIERLTNTVQDISDRLDACRTAAAARHAAWQTRAAAEAQRAAHAHAQLARIAAMTQEMVARETEGPARGGGAADAPADRERYARDLRRAAFGEGGSAESVSRESMVGTLGERGAEGA